MIDIERMLGAAKQKAQGLEAQRVIDEEREEKESAAFWLKRKKENAEARAREEALLQRKPELIEQARQEHQARFQPLQEIIDQLSGPVIAIRDNYFPKSRVFLADHYEDRLWTPPHAGSDKLNHAYYRALLILTKESRFENIYNFLGAYAIGGESLEREFPFGPRKGTQYFVGIGMCPIFISRDKRYWSNFLSLANKVKVDMKNITPEEDLFDITRDYPFVSHFRTAPWLGDIMAVLRYLIPFRRDQKTINAVEARFTDVIVGLEQDKLRDHRVPSNI